MELPVVGDENQLKLKSGQMVWGTVVEVDEKRNSVKYKCEDGVERTLPIWRIGNGPARPASNG